MPAILRRPGYSATLPGVNMLLRALLLLSLSAPLASAAQAKDLRKRVAVGTNLQLGQVPALSVRYGLPTGNAAVNVQLEVLAGFWSVDSADPSVPTNRATAAGRVLYGIVAEDNMNLFIGAGAGAFSVDDAVTTRIQPVMGADVFLFGLENIGFTGEWGMNIDLGDEPGVAITAGAGLHYWF